MPTVPGKYRDIVRGFGAEREKLAGVAFEHADTQPDQHANVLRLADKLGVPSRAVALDPKQFERDAARQDLDALALRSPLLAKWAQNPDNYAVAKDDLGAFDSLEAFYTSAFGTASRFDTALNAPLDQTRSLAAAAPQTIGSSAAGLGRLLGAEGRFMEREANRLSDAGEEDAGFGELMGLLLQGAEDPLRGGGDLLKSVADKIKPPESRRGIVHEVQVGLGQLPWQVVTGGTGLMGQGADIAGDRAQEAGATQEQVDAASAKGAVVTTLSEKLGLGLLMRVLPKWATRGLAGRTADVALGGLGEGGSEAIEGIGHDLIATEYDPDMVVGQGIATDFTVAGAVGLIARGVIQAHPRVRQIEDSEQDAQDLDQLAQIVQASKVAERSPAHIASFVADLKAQGGPQEAFLSAEDFIGFFQSEKEANSAAVEMTGSADALAVALASQGDIAIPMEQFVPFLAKNPEATKKAKLRADGLSADDLGSMDREAEVQKIVGEMVAGVTPETQPDAGIEAELSKFYKPAEAKTMASLLPRFYARIGEATGLSPEDVRAKYPVQVVAERLVGPSLEQSQTDTPEFRNWFGDSKVVDAEGKPLTVYHGTKDDFDTFVHGSANKKDGGWLGEGFYFSNDPSVASRYAQDKPGEDGPRVMPAYLTLKNPAYKSGLDAKETLMLADLRGDKAKLRAETKRLRALGHDGIVWDPGYAGAPVEYVVFDSEQIKSATGNRGTFDPNDPNILHQPDGTKPAPRGAIQFPAAGIGNGASLIHLANADRSTFLHELGHFYLEVLANESGNATLGGEFQKVLDWFGVKDVAAWKALDLEGKRPHHEKFARAFEQYLGEGKAPAPGLKGAFRKFKSWIVGVYKDLKALNVPLSDDVRGVFDRLLASESEIEAAAQQQQYVAAVPVEEAAKLGLSQEQLVSYRDAIEKAKEALAAKLINAELRKKKAAYRAEVKAEAEKLRPIIADLPVYLLRDTIKSGRKLDADATQLAAAFLAPGKITEKSSDRLKGMTMQGGVDPEVMADLFGYKSAEAMLDDLINAPPLDVAVQEQAESLVLQRHGDPLANARELAMEALHNSRLTLALNAELALLTKLAGESYYADPKVISEAAKRVIARTAIRNLRPHQYLVAERKAAAESAKAAAKGKFAEALQAKRAQAFNAALYAEATKAEKEASKARKYLDGFKNLKVQKRLGKTDYRDPINTLLADHDLRQLSRKTQDRRANLAAFVAEKNAQGITVDLPARLVADLGKTPWATLTVEQARELRDAVKHLDHLSRLKNKLLLNGELRDREAIDAEMAASVRDNNEARPEAFGDKSLGDKARDKVLAVRALQGAATDLARELDGFADGGSVWAHTVQVIREAIFSRCNPMLDAAQTALANLYRAHFTPAELRNLKAKRTYDGVPGQWSRERVLSLALNWGNEGNRTAILEQATARLTPEQAATLLNSLSAKEWAFVQGVWDQINTYWPQIAETHKRRSGIAPEKVPASPFTVLIDGVPTTIAGGYYPLKYDADSKRGLKEAVADHYDAVRTGRTAKAATRHGHTEERVGSAGRTVLLDLGVVEGHLRSVIRDLTLGDAVNYVHNVLNGPQFTDAVNKAGLVKVQHAMETWLKDVAAGETVGSEWWDKASRVIRQNFTAAVLTYKVSSAALQVTGYVQTSVVLGKHHAAVGLKRLLSERLAAAQYVHDASAYMRERGKTTVEAVQEVNNARMGHLAAGRSAMIRYGYFMIGRVQRLVDLATWLGAESKGLEMFPNDIAKARAYADDVVSRSQGSQEFADKSSLLRGTIGENVRQSELLRACMVLQSYMMAKGNAAYGRTKVTDFRKPGQAMAWAGDMALLFAVEGMIATVIRQGWPDDDDEDGWLDEATALFFREGAANAFGSLPGMGTAVSELRGYDAKGVIANAWGSVGDAVEQAHQGELDKAALKATTNLSGFAFGVPSSQINKTVDAIDASRDGQQVYPHQYLTGVPKD